jgi:hypothetical protein
LTRKKWREPLLALLAFVFALPSAHAHVGSPNVFFEGQAGPYPVRIVIRPPGVIPGLAEISVRVHASKIDSVSALPMRWNTGRDGAPPPDIAVPVKGETNLYTTQLWFMQGGAQGVEVDVRGEAGPGKVIVPINAIATRVLTMPKSLGSVLAGFGLLLFLLLVSVIGVAVRESVVPPDQTPSVGRVWWSRAVMLLAAVFLAGCTWMGKRWWDEEVRSYLKNRLYRPLETSASVRAEDDRRILRLDITDLKFHRGAPLVPDHGKLMHLFLIRTPHLDAFAHLHPVKLNWKTFECELPELPEGQYDLYADITYETGSSDTLVTQIALPFAQPPAGNSGKRLLDQDDSWRVSDPFSTSAADSLNVSSPLSSEYTMRWLGDRSVRQNEEIRLRFAVQDLSGRAVALQPYMGMLGHLILRRDDGSVFTHLHPSGSFSMASQQLFELRAEGKAPLKVAPASGDPLCQLPSLEESQAAWLLANPPDAEQAISFPYAFPKSGLYRVWAQVKVQGEVLTGVFDINVRGL